MSRLTEDLLTLARVESGEHRFDVQRVSAEELLRDALESFAKWRGRMESSWRWRTRRRMDT